MAVLAISLFTGTARGQSRSAAPVVATSDKDVAAEQQELMRLLRFSPTLLANQDYVRRNNPQLAEYLASHPEIALNPSFYLFSRLGRGRSLTQAVWPEYTTNEAPRPEPPPTGWRLIAPQVVPFAVFACLLGAMLWLLRQFVEGRRWNRIFNLQMEVHNKLIDKFGASQELLAYMNTEAGRRFLEGAPLPVNFEGKERTAEESARILTPIQTGSVLFLLGIGLILVRNADHALQVPMQVLGAATLLPGLGFILSGVAAWLMAGRPGFVQARTRQSHAPSDALETRDGQ